MIISTTILKLPTMAWTLDSIPSTLHEFVFHVPDKEFQENAVSPDQPNPVWAIRRNKVQEIRELQAAEDFEEDGEVAEVNLDISLK